MTTNKKNGKILDASVYALFAVFYLWMAAQIPYTHDDWDWGLDVGINQWLSASVNSRYVGNFFEIIMTRSELLKTLIMGMCFFFIPYLIAGAVAKEEPRLRLAIYLGANFLLLTMSRLMWKQTYGWVAGFANFVLSAVLMILCLMQLGRNLNPETRYKKWPMMQAAACFCLSLMSQLFIENLTIYMTLVTIAACVVSYIKYKRVSAGCVLMMLGSIIGLVIMFSSPIYAGLLEEGSAFGDYRQFHLSSEGGILEKCVNIFMQCGRLAAYAGESHPVASIAVLLLLAVKLRVDHVSMTKCMRGILLGVNLALVSHFVLLGAVNIYDLQNQSLVTMCSAGAYVVFYLVVAYETFLVYRNDREECGKRLLLWLQVFWILLPLVVTTEAGARVFFTSSVFVITFALSVLCDILRGLNPSHIKRINRTGAMIVLIPVMFMICVYSAIGACTDARKQIINSARQEDAAVVVLPQYPYAEFLHCPEPVELWRWDYFKEFYGIGEDVKVVIGNKVSPEEE